MDSPYRLAVDLGTCHTVAVVRRGGEAPRALLFDGTPLLPSGVYATPGGELHVGRDAERMSLLDPARFEPYPKRRIDEGTVLLGDSEVTVVALLAAILRRVVAEAGQAGVSPAGATVLTCPADWGQARRALLLTAAREAGLGQVPLVDEPIAAATYCERVLGQQVGAGRCLAVFDFGGGTLDVTVVRRDPDTLRVLAVGGLDDLGGVDVDAALVGHLGQLVELRSPTVWERLENPNSTGELRDRRTFWSEVRGAKEMLSRVSAAPIQVPGRDEALHITREELERVAGPLVDRAVDETRRVLQRAGVGGANLAGILLVGGSSRIPLVASRLHTRFGIAPTVPEQPELPVAHGALLAPGGPARAPGYPPPGATPPGGYAPPRGYATSPVSGPTGIPVSGLPVSGPPTSGGVPAPMSPAAYQPASMPTSPASWPAPPVSVPGPPSAPPTGPPANAYERMAGHRGPRRARGRVIVTTVIAVVVALCGGGYKLTTSLLTKGAHALGQNALGSGGQVGGFGDSGGPALTRVGQTAKLTGSGVGAATADGQTAYWADVTTGHTQVTAVAAADGAKRWSVAVPVEPADLKLTAVSGLLVLDGNKSATDGGKAVRAVVDGKTGKLLWKAQWENHYDVAYLGTDEIVNLQWPTPQATVRVDLLTGAARWTHKGASGIDDTADFTTRRALPAYAWPGAQAPPAVITQPDTTLTSQTAPFHEWLTVDPANVVELEKSGKGAVLNAANGQPRATGTLGLDIGTDLWTVFDGLVIGAATDDASPDRPRLFAYGLNNLAKRWQVDEPAGTSIKKVRPCGEHLVCVQLDSSGNSSQEAVTAIDTTGHTERWRKPVAFAERPEWYLVGGHLVYDNGAGGPQAKRVLDPAPGSDGRDFGTSTGSLVAADGTRVVLSAVAASIGSGATHWQLSVVDVASGTASKAVDVGTDTPKEVGLDGDVLTVVSAANEVLVLRMPAAK